MNTKPQRAATVDAAEFDAIVRQSRDRALAARQVAELTAEQAAGVGGGLLIDGPFPWGVLPFLKVGDLFTKPVDRMTVPTDFMTGKTGF